MWLHVYDAGDVTAWFLCTLGLCRIYFCLLLWIKIIQTFILHCIDTVDKRLFLKGIIEHSIFPVSHIIIEWCMCTHIPALFFTEMSRVLE